MHHAVFENILIGTVQERYHKEKIEFFYADTDSFKTRNMDKPSADCIIQVFAANASGMTRFELFVIGSLSRHQKCTH